jgi:hypothetical protein
MRAFNGDVESGHRRIASSPQVRVCGKQLAGNIDQSELLLKLNAGELNQAVVISGPNPMPRPDIPNHFIGRFALIGLATLVAWPVHAQPRNRIGS